jgi:hypothetical protein
LPNTVPSVGIDRGTLDKSTNPPTWTTDHVNGHFVRATVGQQQPAYLASVLGFSTINIGAQAFAQVQNPQNICALALGRIPPNSGGSFTTSGSVTFTGNGCALMSDDTVKFASQPTFPPGSNWSVGAVNGCVNSGWCGNPGVPYNYYMTPAVNPLSKLDSDFTTASGSGNPCTGFNGNNANVTNGQTCSIAANTPSTAYSGNLTVNNGGTATFATNGTFFFKDAAISLSGTVTGTNVNIVLLGNSSLSITGGNVNLSANTSNTQYPDLSGVLIDDQAPNRSNLAVNINGNGTSTLNGAMYFPNVGVTYGGTAGIANTTCSAVIANTLTISGNAYMSTNNCVAGTFAQTQVVSLVL